jgi:hypothetical protein
MTTLSRRDFFLGPFSRTLKNQETEPVGNFEVVVGRIFDFPIGKKKLLISFELEIESFPEGIRAQSTEKERRYYSIKTNQIGELVVNRREIWSASQVFSLLTNEPVSLDLSLEDRS